MRVLVLVAGMAALGTVVMGVPPNVNVPWAGSEVTLTEVNKSPASTSVNGKSVFQNV